MLGFRDRWPFPLSRTKIDAEVLDKWWEEIETGVFITSRTSRSLATNPCLVDYLNNSKIKLPRLSRLLPSARVDLMAKRISPTAPYRIQPVIYIYKEYSACRDMSMDWVLWTFKLLVCYIRTLSHGHDGSRHSVPAPCKIDITLLGLLGAWVQVRKVKGVRTTGMAFCPKSWPTDPYLG